MDQNKYNKKIEQDINKRLIIIGSSHIARESKNKVINTFNIFKPTIIALELDKNRAYSLLSNSKQRGTPFNAIFKIGLFGYLFSKIGGYLQKKLGKSIGTSVGIEMKTAMKLAAENNIPVALIDQDIEVTLKKLSKEVGFFFVFRLILDSIVDSLKAMFHIKTKEIEKLKLKNFNLDNVPDEKLVNQIIQVFKKRYPKMYKVLVGERNKIMADRITQMLLTSNDRIMVVVGAGHKKELKELIIKNIKKQMIINNNKQKHN